MKATICEKWEMELGEHEAHSYVQGSTDQWFLDWVLRRPGESSKHITACYAAMQSLRGFEFHSVTEYFGGMGCGALMIEEMFCPDQHVVFDLHPEAVAHMRRVLPAGVEVYRGNSYEEDAPAELAVLDCGDATAIRLLKPPLAQLMDRVALASPKAILLTDIAGERLHLNRERYGPVLGRVPESYPDYLRALSDLIESRWGYKIHDCYYHRWSAVMSLVPRTRLLHAPRVQPAPEHPKGIELC